MTRYKIIFRIIADLALIALVAWAPVYAVAIFAVVSAWIFAPFYEIVICGLAVDSLYGFHSVIAIVIAVLVFALVEIFKKKTRI